MHGCFASVEQSAWQEPIAFLALSLGGNTIDVLVTATLQQVKATIPAQAGLDRRFPRLRVTRP